VIKPLVDIAPDGKHLLRVDASAYRGGNCYRRTWYETICGLTTSGKDFKMEYGVAFHKALQEFYTTGDTAKAREIAAAHYNSTRVLIPDTDWRTPSHLDKCLEQYFTEWKVDIMRPLVIAGKPVLEQFFEIPWYETAVTRVLLCGLVDMLASVGGNLVVVDHKTTSLTQVETYLGSYTLSPQLMTYMLAMRIINHPVTGGMINGIFLNKYGRNQFKRSPVLDFSAAKLDIHAQRLMSWTKELTLRYETTLSTGNNTFVENYTDCEQKYGMCAFAPLCRLDSDDHRATVAAVDYKQKLYNPLTFQQA